MTKPLAQIKATRPVAIERGYKFDNWGYITVDLEDHKSSDLRVHSSLRCEKIFDRNFAQYIPIVIDSTGQRRLGNVNITRKVWWCGHCPKFSEDWKDDALCFDVYLTEDFGSESRSERDRLISQYCHQCPVQRECLEYGAGDPSNWGMIFGGLYFVQDISRRNKAIENRRKELG